MGAIWSIERRGEFLEVHVEGGRDGQERLGSAVAVILQALNRADAQVRDCRKPGLSPGSALREAPDEAGEMVPGHELVLPVRRNARSIGESRLIYHQTRPGATAGV